MILLTETNVYTRSAINVKGFQGFSVVRVKNMGGGILLGVRHGLYETVMLDIGDKVHFITTRLTNKDFNVQIVLVYGTQENDPEDIREYIMMLYHGIREYVMMFLYKFRQLI